MFLSTFDEGVAMRKKLDITNEPFVEDDIEYIDLEKQVMETTRSTIEKETARGSACPPAGKQAYRQATAGQQACGQSTAGQPLYGQPSAEQRASGRQAAGRAASGRRTNRSHKGLVAVMAMILVVLMTATACVLLIQENRKLNRENAEAQDELARYASAEAGLTFSQAEMEAYAQESAEAAVENSKAELLQVIKQDVDAYGVLTMLRNLYPKDLVIAADGKYNFIPIIDSLPKHNLDPDKFVITEKKDYEYYEDGVRISHRGVDVSRFQGNIDWKRVANDNVEFAIVRLGLRGYGTGEIKLDANYVANISGALAAGLDVGVYFYSQAITEEEAREEAEFVIENLKGYDINLPVIMDIEYVDGDNGRANNLTVEERTRIANVFCETISAAGYEPMIYGNTKTFVLMLDLTKLEGIRKWFAYYNLPLYYPYEFSMFQYSESGRVDGIPEKVDLNIMIGDYPTF